ncbi:MAG: hypothetical protein CMF31_02125 [Kordiimonas sp.]|nr:hypothetical protein [Kordiimonas sp.]
MRKTASSEPVSRNIPRSSESAASPYLEKDHGDDALLQNVREKGYAAGLRIAVDAVDEILNYCQRQQFSPNRDAVRKVPFSLESDDPSLRVLSLMNPHENNEIVKSLSVDKTILSVVEGYFKSSPVLHSSQIWVTLPTAGKPEHHDYGFHYDIDAYEMLKVFFYLTEVDTESGPHVLIEATHREGTAYKFFNRRLSDEQAADRYGDRVKSMMGRKGEGFFEDTFAYHKGQYPKRARVILQLEYVVG